MKVILNLVAAATLVAAGAFASETFVVDKAHSEATFQVRHLVSRVSGKFDDFTGAINIDRENPAASSVEFNIKTASIDTGNENRDKDLRGANFFEVDKFPEISFKSTGIKPGANKDPWGGERAGFSVHTTLNRKDYGINWNKVLDNGGTLLSDDVDINVNIESARSKKDIQGEVKKEKS